MKTTVMFGFLAKILIFLGFLGKNNCKDLGKKFEVIQNYPKLSKILIKKPRRQALGNLSSQYYRTLFTGRLRVPHVRQNYVKKKLFVWLLPWIGASFFN